ncbi:MAG: hypothetical protein HFG80_02210 [Eubacterium sp.]|nr:hypothetical protein [Eubacterium sp.]
MEDIKAILKENFEHYDEECQKLLKYTEEKDPGFEERSKYAGFLKEPVRKKQILFWSRGWKSCADVPNYLFEQLYQMYGKQYTYIWVADENNKSAKNLQNRVTFVENGTEEFWRALACSEYLIGNTILPNSFVKREEQVYINSMTAIPTFFQKRSADVNQHSLIMTEMLKTDYLISDSKWMTDKICMEEYQLSGIYSGEIITQGNLRASYMKRQNVVPNEVTKFVLVIKEKETYEWMKKHLQELQTDNIEVQAVRNFSCNFGGKDICDFLAESDVVIGDYSNYLRDAKEYGCKVCRLGDKDEYQGFEEYDIVDGWEELKNYIKENSTYRRKNQDIPTDVAEQLINRIFENRGNRLTTPEHNRSGKKKIMFLTEWDLPRKQRNFIRRMVEETDHEKYDVIVVSPTVPNDYLNREWSDMTGEMRRICYRGRKVLTEKEYIFFRLMERKPFLYVKHEEIREAMDLILEKEWKRRWGNLEVDTIVLCGQKARQYFAAAGSHAAEKALASEVVMSDYRQENTEEWQKTLEVFDEIYLLPVNFRKRSLEYGIQNQKKAVKYPFLFSKVLTEKNEIEHTVIAGTEYLVADKWRVSEEREQLCLVKMPEKGSCILNTELAPDEKRIAFLQEKLKDIPCVLFLGENFEAYRPYITCEYRKLDDIVWQELYMLPTAKEYFSHIDLYIGDERLEDDVMKEICKEFTIII